MDLRKLMIKNSDGKRSATMTAFVLGFIVVNLKLILSGVTIGSVTLSPFSGTEYAASLAALGAIYVLRRGQGKEKEENDNQ